MSDPNPLSNTGNILELYTQRYNKAGEQGRMWNTILYGLNGTTIKSLNVDANGNLQTVDPPDSYTLAYDGSKVGHFATDGTYTDDVA